MNDRMILRFLKKVRVQLWWNHIAPPIIASIYFVVWHSYVHDYNLGLSFLLFTISLFCISAFGYLLNDITDLKADELAGKSNSAADLNYSVRGLILTGLLLAGLVPWIWLPKTSTTFGLVVLLIFLLVIYSVHPFRFKERGFAGLLCDIHYGHILPVYIAVNTFSILLVTELPYAIKTFTLLYILLFTKGLRNILMHQQSDTQADIKAGIKTFTTSSEPKKIIRIINLVFITEILLLILLFSVLTKWLLLVLGLFILVSGFLLISWGLFRLPMSQMIGKIWFMPNDFYEEWLPMALVIMVTVKHPQLWWLIPLHLMVFSKGIKNIILDFRSLSNFLFLMIKRFYFEHIKKILKRL